METQRVKQSTKTREDAWELLNEYTKNANLIKHALAVEAAMRHYASHFKEDPDVWGMVGLLHDFDYEKYPTLEEHPYKGQAILKDQGYPDVVRQGIMAHAPHTGTPRNTRMEKAIFAVDELCGFIVAVTLVKPSKKVADVDVKSVKKKLKQKKFAEAVSREDIAQGASELELELDQHIEHVLTAMQKESESLGL